MTPQKKKYPKRGFYYIKYKCRRFENIPFSVKKSIKKPFFMRLALKIAYKFQSVVF
jgi:hypothetical protein